MKRFVASLTLVALVFGAILFLRQPHNMGNFAPSQKQISENSAMPASTDASPAAVIKPVAQLSAEHKKRLLNDNPYIPSHLESEWEKFALEQGVKEEGALMKERLARYTEGLELISQAMQACNSERSVGLDWIARAGREFGSVEFQRLHKEFGRAIVIVGLQRKDECQSDMEEHGLVMEAELQKSAVALKDIVGRFADSSAVAAEDKESLAAFQVFLSRFSENPSPLSIILASTPPRAADVRVMQFVQRDPAFQGLYDPRKSMLIYKNHMGY